MKIAVGMSGGVDSSVAAFLLKQLGHDICGRTMRIWHGENSVPNARRHACYSPGEEEEIERASDACARLGIRHHIFDLSKEYENTVLGYFKSEYKNGRTPNPCVVCNQRIKFGLLPGMALASLDAEAFATGHYAKLGRGEKNRIILMKAKDTAKDQSYFLYRLGQEQLRTAMFPLGDMLKDDVKKIAREAGLPSWNEPESQDFYDGSYSELLGCADTPGEIVDTEGKVLGFHKGIWNYTVGQRRGLGIASGAPLYVKAIDPAGNRIVAAYREDTLRDSFVAASFNWVSEDSLDGISAPTVKVRSSQKSVPCEAVMIDKTTVRVNLASAQGEIAAGQSAVLYSNNILIGGGTIEYES
ncbi:MAG: tRNA 2-thiouridine(34) synthase MnmA [Spirochaetia bacterium]|jgi:tRNA-specific 2-thiouridylase|nr:tRNA 2-thiouridine(34) synthase MnmA [Spirochaetia bacterium]